MYWGEIRNEIPSRLDKYERDAQESASVGYPSSSVFEVSKRSRTPGDLTDDYSSRTEQGGQVPRKRTREDNETRPINLATLVHDERMTAYDLAMREGQTLDADRPGKLAHESSEEVGERVNFWRTTRGKERLTKHRRKVLRRG